MKLLFAFLSLFIFFSASSQYYYIDRVGSKETSGIMQTYLKNKVNRVVLTSYDETNSLIKDFYVEQVFDEAKKVLKTTTRSNEDHQSLLLSYLDANNLVTKTIDSSDIIVSSTQYNYDPSGNLLSLITSSKDSSGRTNETEQHIWNYNNGNITGMLRIKNKRDSSFIAFKTDENGNVIEEQETRRGNKADLVYYYFDASNRLTDIVRYNKKVNKLLPEYMFEYSRGNQLIQKITVPANSNNYLIWRFQYNNQGLKTKEAIYNKQKQLTGKIEYNYTYGQ